MQVGKSLLYGFAVSVLLTTPVAVSAAAPPFKPDVPLQGSSLRGLYPLGGASCSVKAGKITGTSSCNDGWLVLEKPFQDVAVYSSFLCNGPCSAGYSMRAEKTGGTRFEPHSIGRYSDGGSDLAAAEVNKVGKLDIVTSTRFGTFIFLNQIQQRTAKATR